MNKIYTGVVEDIDDPLKSDRVRVRVFGLHTDDKNLIPTDSLPWAQVMKPADSASISGIGRSGHGLVCGTWVKLIFEDQDQQYPFILGSISGVSTNPNIKASYEEVAFGTAEEQRVAENPPEDKPKEPITDDCEANINIDKFRSKFGAANVNAVLQECCKQGIKNGYAKIGILAVVAKECNFVPRNESFKYTVSRLRQVFPTKTAAYTDYQLQDIVSSEETLANFLYGGRYGNAKDEGFKFRGRGFIQITFKANYELASGDTGEDLVSNPDRLNAVDIASKAAVKYIVRRTGGLGLLNSFVDQATANRTVSSAVIGKNVSLGSGYGLEYYNKVTDFSKLGYVIGEDVQATPIGNQTEEGQPSDGLTTAKREMLANTNVGFKDPSGRYPLPELLNEPDTNRLTRRNTDERIFNTKKKQRRTGILNVGGEFEQPRSPYNTKYPYNRGYYSESGHALEFDDTEGQERVNMFHRSGTFTEIDNFGNRVNKIIGNDYTIIEKNGYLYIDGTLRMTVASTAHITINGDVNMAIDGSYNLDVGGDCNIKAGGDIALHAGTNCSMKADGNASIDGARIDWNSGASKSLGPSSRDPQNNDYPQVLGESVETSEMISVDDMDYDEAETYIATAIAENKITKEEVEKAAKTEAKEADKTVPEQTISPLPGNCAVFSDRTNIPPATSISKYFTLADVSTRVALPSERNKVVAHMGLSEAQIVCNLKKLAENSLDPIKEKYSDMIITNAFRKNTNKSQHNIGQAADLQFTTASASEYFNIAKWIKDNVLFDQLLLEYRSNGRPWIHISYTDNPRKQVLTLMNHKTHSQGLSNLA